jgi:hypothetical protein
MPPFQSTDISIFLGLDGTPTRKVGIEWTGVPEEMGEYRCERLGTLLYSKYSHD